MILTLILTLFIYFLLENDLSEIETSYKFYLLTLFIAGMACVCRRYNARSDWLIVTELWGVILP